MKNRVPIKNDQKVIVIASYFLRSLRAKMVWVTVPKTEIIKNTFPTAAMCAPERKSGTKIRTNTPKSPVSDPKITFCFTFLWKKNITAKIIKIGPADPITEAFIDGA